ncbi:hypothetical protein pb186bvf_000895 [Paramecium bursaria]
MPYSLSFILIEDIFCGVKLLLQEQWINEGLPQSSIFHQIVHLNPEYYAIINKFSLQDTYLLKYLKMITRQQEKTQLPNVSGMNDTQKISKLKGPIKSFDDIVALSKSISSNTMEYINFFSNQNRELYQIDTLLDDENAILIHNAVNNSPPKTNWPQQLKKLLVWIILKLYVNMTFSIQKIPSHIWEIVARVLKRTTQDVKYKWLSFSKKSILQSPWTREEDNLLISIINQFSKLQKQNQWRAISLKLSKYNKSQTLRLGKHCRERWFNHLNTDIDRSPWTMQECLEVLNLVKQNGKKWSKIAKIMQRNENQVKNKFNGLMRQQISIEEVENKLKKKICNEGIFFESQETPKELDLNLSYGLVNLITQELYLVDRQYKQINLTDRCWKIILKNYQTTPLVIYLIYDHQIKLVYSIIYNTILTIIKLLYGSIHPKIL